MSATLRTRDARHPAAVVALFAIACAASASAQDHTVVFGTQDAGISRPVPHWGLDVAWASYDNMRRGLIYMGQDNVDLVRVVFLVNQPLVDGALTDSQKSELGYAAGIAALAGTDKPWTMTCGTGDGVDAWYKNGSEVIPSRWVQAMEAAATYYNHPIVGVEGFNEPDYGWNQGTIQNLYDISALLHASSVLGTAAVSGPATLNCDAAIGWYDPIKSQLDEGTTHQLAGTFNGYVNFYQDVIASGDVPINPEVHSLVEVIAGAEYGLDTGIWWGTAELARGGFVQACKGSRLAYAEDRSAFTAAAIYRAPSGSVSAFLGSSERQGGTSTYRFFARDRKVFYDGHGPTRDYTVAISSDNDRVVNITWGSDAAPAVGGRYIIVNRNSGRVMEVAGAGTTDGTNIQQNAYTGATNQQWDIAPYSSAYGDQSFHSINVVHTGKAVDVNNFSYDDGTNVQQWSDTSADNQKWYFEYAGNGFFYIRSRWNGKYLEVVNRSRSNGANIDLWSSRGTDTSQQWRLLPLGAAVEFTAPDTPANLAASADAVSVHLTWSPSTASDVASYTILRSDTVDGSYDIIARDLATTAYTDESANQPHAYYYKVRAVDQSLNKSVDSAAVSAAPTGAPTLVARWRFDGTPEDASGNGNTCSITGTSSYTTGRVGAQALVLDGSTARVNMPSDVSNFDTLTVAAWVYWNGGGAWQRIFDFGNGTSQYLFLTPYSGSNLRFAIKNGGAEQQLNATTLATGQWVHVAVTLGAGSAQLYVNGAAVASSSAITIKPSDFLPAVNYVGDSQFEADPPLNGRIDDMRVYNYALSASDVAAIVAGRAVAPTQLAASLGTGQIDLAWDAVADATSYTVKRGTASGGPYTTIASNVVSAAYADTTATAGTTYYYVVSAHNTAGDSDASGQASATLLTPAQSWRMAHFATTDNAGSAADTADPDGDGIVNLLERAFGGDPNIADVTILPSIDDTAPVLSIVYRKSAAATDTTITVQECSDLAPGTWTEAIGTSSVLSDDGTTQVVRFTTPMGSATKKFLSLRVDAP